VKIGFRKLNRGQGVEKIVLPQSVQVARSIDEGRAESPRQPRQGKAAQDGQHKSVKETVNMVHPTQVASQQHLADCRPLARAPYPARGAQAGCASQPPMAGIDAALPLSHCGAPSGAVPGAGRGRID
jgi:hypothetical protein